jgi:hypothetical protein
MFAHFVNGDDIGMRELRCRFGFTQQLASGFVIRELTGEEHFQRDDAIQSSVAGFVNNSHAAPANLLNEFVFAEKLSRFRVL